MVQSRAEYSAIPDRAPLRLPNQARVAAWVIINVEDWQFGEPLPRAALPAPQGVAVMPDVPNYSWFEYGLRVGFWRIKDALDRRGIKATVSLNASVCDTYPRLVEACVESDWEILAHGYVQRAINVESDERDVIRRTVQRIAQQTGRRPRGWMGPGLHETYATPDILAEEGIEYCCDWVNDDQPYSMRVSRGRLVSIPYTVELNDIPIFLVQHHPSSEMFERARDTLGVLLREGAQSARVLPISVHPYITGVAHRMPYFEHLLDHLLQHRPDVVLLRGSDILDWYLAATSELPARRGT